MNVRSANIGDHSRPGLTRAECLAILAVLAVAFAALVPVIGTTARQAKERANLALCEANLRSIGAGLLAYAQDHGGALPVSPTLENPHLELVKALAKSNYLHDPALFYCPSDQRTAYRYTKENFDAGIIGYYYYSASGTSANDGISRFLRSDVQWPRILNTHLDSRMWVMSDIWVSGEPTAHASTRKGVNYLMLDGAVQFVAESPRREFH